MVKINRKWAVVTCLMALLIWGNSLVPGSGSGSLSLTVMEAIRGFLHGVGLPYEWVTNFVVRKCAHFTEYMVLGILATHAFDFEGRHTFDVLLPTAVFLLLPGCGVQKTPDTGYTKYSAQFYGTFDTVVQIVGYCKTEEEFSRYAGQIKSRMEELSQLYDIYYEYSDENNLKTINDNAGIQPVPVREEILDLIEFCQEWYGKTDGKVNIALGPVLSIWHNYMERYSADPTDAKLPKIESLMEKLPVCNIEDVIVDREAGTVYLAKEGMSLDVGAVAKGYATQLACQEAYDAGFTSFIVSAGGNVVAADPPLDGIRSGWGIGIQDPFTAEELGGGNSIDVAYVNNTCVVTSGDYQRYYMVGKQRVHHIIDPDTLMPAAYYRGVTVIIPDSGIADLASTTLYTLPYEDSRAMAEKMGWEAMWIFADGTVECTDGMIPLLRDRGGADGLLK